MEEKKRKENIFFQIFPKKKRKKKIEKEGETFMVFQRTETRHLLVLLRPQPRNYLANPNQREGGLRGLE